MPDGIDDADFKGLDVVVHGALVEHGPKARDSDAQNREGTRRVLAAARAHGARIVFLSTLSAHLAATSHYGRSKLELESMFDPARDCVLKLGLVLGDGGLFGGMAALLRGARVVPLPGGGRQPIQVLWMGDLEDAVLAVIDRSLTGTYAVAHPEVRTMRELYTVVSAGLGTSPVFVPLPLPLVELGAATLEALRVPFPIRRENVLGLKQLRAFDTAPSLHALGIAQPVGLEAAVARLFAGAAA
jgi:nucleoside-diphosphate-sugar epimerase